MSHHLVELERKARALKIAGRNAEAAELYSAIVEEQPDWEHGTALHLLAQCYEDSGQLELAEENYRAALRYEPANDIFLGGFASFLYLHGNPEDEFRAYLDLLVVEKRSRFEDGIERTMIGLKALGAKLGWSDARVAELIEGKRIF
jgi:tetratricopeptide (TPR) repeat protein